MKKKINFILLFGFFLSGCGSLVNKDTQKAYQTVSEENAYHEKKRSEKLENESLASIEAYPINIQEYINQVKKNSNVVVNEEKENDTFDTYELSYRNGEILEKITTYKNQDQPIGYTIEISNKTSAPEKNQSTNFEYALVICSGFLMDTKEIEKQLHLLFEIKTDKTKEYDINDALSLTVSPQGKKDIILTFNKNSNSIK